MKPRQCLPKGIWEPSCPISAWSLHSRLKEDTIDIGDPAAPAGCLSSKDAHYPWLLLVPRRPETVEIIDLDEVEQAQLMTEINRVARSAAERNHPHVTSSISQPSAIWCRNCTFISSRAAQAMAAWPASGLGG